MENNILYNVETSWAFPMIQYSANISFVEVRKASGIAFILLELISRSENNTEKLVTTLYNLGVPYDIHYIFGDEIANMISYNIIQMKSHRDFGSDLLNLYHISDFEITELGKKLFSEGTIPTEKNGSKKLTLFYDLPAKNIMIKPSHRLFRFDDSAIESKCFSDIQLNNDDIELFVSENMNRFGFKKGETITEYKHDPPEYVVYKSDDAVNIRIDKEKMYLSAADKMHDAYIREYYSVDVISDMLMAKKKYKFSDKLTDSVRSYNYSDLTEIVGINMPSEMSKVLDQKNQLSMGIGVEMKNSDCIVNKHISEIIFDQLKIEGCACYYENGKPYHILPGCFNIEADGFNGKCKLNLIVTERLPEELSDQILHSLYNIYSENESINESCKIIKAISEVTGNNDYLDSYVFSIMERFSDIEEKVNAFLSMNEEFKGLKTWSEISVKNAKLLFEIICRQITTDNFASMNLLGSKLSKILKMHESDYLNDISQNLKDNNDDMTVYEMLEKSGYSIDSILSAVNILKLFCTDILEGISIPGKTKLGTECNLLGQSLAGLKEITGIYNVSEDPAELDIDSDTFIKLFAAFEASLRKIEKYKLFAKSQLDELSLFRSRFAEIKNLLMIEKEASADPRKIDKTYIGQMLRKSRYKDAICDLHIRLQYELNRLFDTKNASTYDLLNHPEIDNYLSKDEINEMQRLRKCRNEFQHPTDKRTVSYSEKVIQTWCNIVEEIGEMNNESRSKN